MTKVPRDSPDWNRLFEIAAGQQGLFTTQQAAEAGYSPQLLAHYVQGGPRSRPSTRVKDLPDIALLATAQTLDARCLREALAQTFTFRKTHSLPAKLPVPLSTWTTPYAAMAREDKLEWSTLDDVTRAAQAFLDPVLEGRLDATWEPEAWGWRLH